MKSLIETSGTGFRQIGEVQIPNLIETDTNYFIGVLRQSQ